MNKNFTQEDINKAIKDVLYISAENFIILGINNDGIDITSLLDEETTVSYIIDSLSAFIIKRAKEYDETLEQTLSFTKKEIISELEERISRNFKSFKTI